MALSTPAKTIDRVALRADKRAGRFTNEASKKTVTLNCHALSGLLAGVSHPALRAGLVCQTPSGSIRAADQQRDLCHREQTQSEQCTGDRHLQQGDV